MSDDASALGCDGLLADGSQCDRWASQSCLGAPLGATEEQLAALRAYCPLHQNQAQVRQRVRVGTKDDRREVDGG